MSFKLISFCYHKYLRIVEDITGVIKTNQGRICAKSKTWIKTKASQKCEALLELLIYYQVVRHALFSEYFKFKDTQCVVCIYGV